MRPDFASIIGRLELNRAISRQADGPWRLQQAKRLKKRLQKHFEKQQTFVLREAKTLSIFTRRKNAVDPADEKEIDLLVSRIPEKDAVADTLTLFWQASMLKGGKTIVRQLKLGEMGISFTLQNKEAIRWLKAKKVLETSEPGSLTWSKAANELRLSNYKGNIHFTTKTRIKDILIEAAENGYSYQQTSKLIQAAGDAGVFSQARGETISTMEIGRAYQVGNKIPMDDFQEAYPDRQALKHWQSVGDYRVSEECRGYDAQGWKPLNHMFGYYDTPPGHVKCRCTLVYKIESPKEQ